MSTRHRPAVTSSLASARSRSRPRRCRCRRRRRPASSWSAVDLAARPPRVRSSSLTARAPSHAGRSEPDIHRLPVQQPRDRAACAISRLSNSATTGVGEGGVCGGIRRRQAIDARARTVTLEDGTRLDYDRLVLAPGIDIRWDGLARLRRSGRRADAARLEGRRADAAAAPSARGDGGRRHRRHVGAGQPVPLPARSLRAREPDRALPQDHESRSRS